MFLVSSLYSAPALFAHSSCELSQRSPRSPPYSFQDSSYSCPFSRLPTIRLAPFRSSGRLAWPRPFLHPRLPTRCPTGILPRESSWVRPIPCFFSSAIVRAIKVSGPCQDVCLNYIRNGSRQLALAFAGSQRRRAITGGSRASQTLPQLAVSTARTDKGLE